MMKYISSWEVLQRKWYWRKKPKDIRNELSKKDIVEILNRLGEAE